MKKKQTETEYKYFQMRKPEKIYVSKSFPFFKYRGVITNEKRYVRRVFEKEKSPEFAEVKGEIVLRENSFSRYQVSAIVYSKKDTNLMEFTLQRFIKNEDDEVRPLTDYSFTFSQDEFTTLLKFLSDLKFLDFSDKERFVVDTDKFKSNRILLNLTKPDPNKVLVDKELGDLISKLSHLDKNERKEIVEKLKGNVFTKYDLDILSGRKDGLEEFKENLIQPYKFNELQWQEFFKNNPWIFGYGLNYKFLNILQKEASVSSIDLDGKNQVKSDFLLADNNFTVLVELKRPDTKLFEKEGNRSESWRLSKDLTYAVSQILAQKAEWEINYKHKEFDDEGNPIKQTTVDPKTILIIGHTEQFSGDRKEDLIKKKTFELYRRNSRNIEILTYDELLERAKFIINDNNEIEEDLNIEQKKQILEEEDDLPF